MKVTIIDCFDSFSYNLFQMVGCLGGIPHAVTCDMPLERVRETDPDYIILSPGPGTPEDSGICPEVIREFGGIVPILGVCLGHQTILQTYGGKISRMNVPVHGKTSSIIHTGKGVFSGLPNPFSATRYHSLAVSPEDIPEEFETLAVSADDLCLMAVRHRELPITGVQFHPESIMTPEGMQLVKNFLLQRGA
ncbi:MAG TPA: aminodeoxychorismate/anthranilate synthase component II [Methanoregulaceae archaeon]|nr:aminodeoxychorismate/anthranilate synthase component II [Methanoregulaceae archaeon]